MTKSTDVYDLYVVTAEHYYDFPQHTVLLVEYDEDSDHFEISDCAGYWRTIKLFNAEGITPLDLFESHSTFTSQSIRDQIETIEMKVRGGKVSDMVKNPNHYQLFPEYDLEVKDINKRLLDKIEDSEFDMTFYEAGWYQQAMQYFQRFYSKNGIEDIEKGIQTMQFVLESMKDRH